MGGWNQAEGKIFLVLNFVLVESLMEELDPNHQGDVNEEEFLLILKYI